MIRSKFTYSILSKPGNLLIYNSLRGLSSFIKFCGDDATKAQDCLNSPDSYIGTNVYEVLKEYGIIVPEGTEEDLCIAMSWKKIFSSCLTLVIMPTEDCNFRCSYCYEDHKKGVMSTKTARAIIYFVAKNIASHTELHVTWFGGEPLMSNQTIGLIKFISAELIKICSCAKKKYTSDIITNGYNLTYDVFKQLLECKIFSYQVTIDGTSNTHDKQRFLETGEKTHDQIISNLLSIKQNCRKRYFSIVIRTNITLEMENSLIDHYTELSECFSNDPRFSFFFRPVGNWGGDRIKLLCNNMFDSVSFRAIYNKLLSLQTKLNLNFSRFAFFYNDSTCSSCYENAYIVGFDGKIYKCSCHFDDITNAIGFLEDTGVMVLDSQKKAKWVRAPELKESCKKCFFAPVCLNMACPIYSNMIRSTSLNADNCPYEKKYIKETFLLLDNNGFFKPIALSNTSIGETTNIEGT